jgi:hypothetical protein
MRFMFDLLSMPASFAAGRWAVNRHATKHPDGGPSGRWHG